MKPEKPEVNNRTNLTGLLIADKKKIVAAAILIAVMVFMWIKVLFGKESAPEAAAGIAPVSVVSGQSQASQEVQVCYISLPVTPGRNDVLVRDIFDSKGFKRFAKKGFAVASDESPGDISESQIQQIAEKLKIGAIISGPQIQKPEAFIEDKLVSVGSKLSVGYDDQIYEFTVTQINENQIVLKWKDSTVIVKMSEL